MQARGLKPPVRIEAAIRDLVAPHAGAWIETNAGADMSSIFEVAPHAGAWIETDFEIVKLSAEAGRASCRRVD